jgi:hypothetical protein
MKNLFEAGVADELKERISLLQPDSPRLWGKMNVAQMLEHCSRGTESALGDLKPPRMLIGRILGGLIKSKALGNDQPMRRNSPTVPRLVVLEDCDLAAERDRLCCLIDRFVAEGPAGCTTHPHAFFGNLKPDEWAELMYKHLDHHLRQFGV